MPKVRNRLRREYDMLDIPINEIDPHPNQPRKDYSEKLLRELSASIAKFGVIQPLSVRVRRGRYELVSGERRLRLLKLSPDVLDTLRTSGLSERHGRAPLRLASTEAQRNALHCMIEDNMNVALAEEYVETLLNPPPPQSTAPRVGKTLFVIKDVRMFLNSMHRWLSVMRSQGVNISCKCDESNEAVTITVRIPKGDKNDKI